MLALGLKTAGRLSPEIHWALRHGFASGVAVERVYANQPRRSCTPVGRWLDGMYLRSPANAALRARQTGVQEAVETAVRRLRARGEDLRLFDPAAGAGRTGIRQMRLEKAKGTSARAVLGDHAAVARDAAHAAAQDAGVGDRVVVVETDAWDPASLQARAQGLAPNLVVVAGLYELEPDDAKVTASLNALATLAAPLAFLVITGMNTHPQAALIERLTGTAPPPGRTADALAERVAHAGFSPVQRWPGDRGVFDVVLLERRECAGSP